MSGSEEEVDAGIGESGSGLRGQLEAQIQTNKELTSKLTAREAEAAIRDGGLDLVKVEDLTDIPLDEISGRASALQERRLADTRSVLVTRVGEEEADRILAAESSEGTTSQVSSADEDAIRRTRQVGATQGAPPRESPFEGKVGPDRMRAALESKK